MTVVVCLELVNKTKTNLFFIESTMYHLTWVLWLNWQTLKEQNKINFIYIEATASLLAHVLSSGLDSNNKTEPRSILMGTTASARTFVSGLVA